MQLRTYLEVPPNMYFKESSFTALQTIPLQFYYDWNPPLTPIGPYLPSSLTQK